MKGRQRDVQANAGCGRRVVKRAAPGWALALVLTGLGVGAIAAGAESGGHGAGRGESGMPALDQRRCPQCPANSPADTGASMQPGPGRATKGAEPGGEGRLRAMSVPRSAMNALFPLGAARVRASVQGSRTSVRSDRGASARGNQSSRADAEPGHGATATDTFTAARRCAPVPAGRSKSPGLRSPGRRAVVRVTDDTGTGAPADGEGNDVPCGHWGTTRATKPRDTGCRTSVPATPELLVYPTATDGPGDPGIGSS